MEGRERGETSEMEGRERGEMSEVEGRGGEENQRERGITRRNR